MLLEDLQEYRGATVGFSSVGLGYYNVKRPHSG